MGKLSIIATPIGNLEDITLRAIRILKEADLILCEDTRVAHKLLEHYNIKNKTVSYHQHSGEFKSQKIKSSLEAGGKIALISDAGTPGISDPGNKLVSMLRQELPDIYIEAIPGPSALGAALSLAGIGFNSFAFYGFLPHKKGRQKMLDRIMTDDLASILYESKHRIIKLLEEIKKREEELGKSKEIIVLREITKMHESFYQGSSGELVETLESDPNNLKGEFVVLIRDRD